jgi:hypothetical protein
MGVTVRMAVGVSEGGGWVAVGEGRSVAVGGRIVLVVVNVTGSWVGVTLYCSQVGDSVMIGMVADGWKAGAAGEQAARQANPARAIEKNLQ